MAPRAQTSGNPSLRNRNRVTNKTRLKVIKGNIDADPIVLDEDEERARVVSTAGVDAEDANEHHLQAVLSAASHRATTLAQRTPTVNGTGGNTRQGEASKPVSGPRAFIPVPDAEGIAENVDELYPLGRWVEYATYIKFSDTVDESLFYGLNDGFTYIMDERDEEWLEKNNQEARGEGTSSQASASTPGATTRSGGHRSTKSKGKEVETSSPVVMNEDEFELVMGLYEKVTHDNAPFLHVSFQQQQGSCIPPFSEYQDVFANELPRSHFSRYMQPPILPPSSTLSRMAKAIYPHWRERKIDREGHRIIPTLNFDESDMKNESYICFRRRDTKAIRKTRAAQVSSSEKLSRLKNEIVHAADLARHVLARERCKKETHVEAKAVWEKRMTFLDLKRKYPLLAGKDDEEILIEKERPPKKTKSETAPLIRINRPTRGDASASPAPAEPQMRPKDRHAAIQATMEAIMKRMKEADHGWDDQVDSSYQQASVPLPDKHFKPVSDDSATTPTVTEQRHRGPLFLRLRRGRGGRAFVDRRRPHPPETESLVHFGGGKTRKSLIVSKEAEARNVGKNVEMPEIRENILDEDRMARLFERWRFDNACDVAGAEEEDRVLLDDYDPKHMRIQAMLLSDTEALMTDTRLLLFDSQTGTHSFVNPVKTLLGTPQSRKETSSYQQARVTSSNGMQTGSAPLTAPPQAVPVAQPTNSIPNPLQSPVKLAGPTSTQHSRAPSNGPQRPSSSASMNNVQPIVNPNSSPPANQTNAIHVNGVPSQSSPVNGMPAVALGPANGVGNTNGNGMIGGSNVAHSGLPSNFSSFTAAQQQALIMRHKHQNMQNMQKFYNYAANIQRTGQAPFSQAVMNGAGGDSVNATSNGIGVNNSSLMGSVNMNLKLPAQRQMQWASAVQRSQSAQNGGIVNGNDLAAMQNLQSMQNMQQLAGLGLLQSHNMPSVNGHNHLSPPRSAQSPSNALGHALSLSPHMGSPAQSQSHVSPSRNMQTPVPHSPSPLLQHQIPNLIGGMPSQNQGF